MPRNNLTPKQHLAAARQSARLIMPYFTRALYALVPQPCPGLKTVGIGNDFRLFYDPKTIVTWTVQQLAWALLHEMMHVLMKHSTRAQAMHVHTGEEAKDWNWAGDAEINDDLEAAGAVWPFKPVTPGALGCETGKPAEVYYRAIREMRRKQEGQDGAAGAPGAPGDEKGTPGAGGEQEGEKPGPGKGWCGRGAGRPLPGEPDSGSGKGAGQEGDGGQSPGQMRGRNETEIERIRRGTAKDVQKAASKGRGTVPGGMLRWAEDVVRPPKVRWQDKLARAAKFAVNRCAGADDYHYGRPARRQASIGYGLHVPILPSTFAYSPEVAVVIDTSGSMSTEDLRSSVSEADAILKNVGAPVTFLSVDSAVHAVEKVRSWQDLVKNLKGGGGTSFVPAFETLDRMQRKPNVVIFFTDGGGDAPTEPPAGYSVIWVIVGDHTMIPWGQDGEPISWGEKIEVPHTTDEEAAA